MLLLLQVQLPGFGTFAGETAKEVVPGRMTYNSVSDTVVCDRAESRSCSPARPSYVCDRDWSGSGGSLVLDPYMDVGCISSCTKVIGEHSANYDWCYTDTGVRTTEYAADSWCWCEPQDCSLLSIPGGVCTACEPPGVPPHYSRCRDHGHCTAATCNAGLRKYRASDKCTTRNMDFCMDCSASTVSANNCDNLCVERDDDVIPCVDVGTFECVCASRT